MRYINWATALLLVLLACPAQAAEIDGGDVAAKPDLLIMPSSNYGANGYTFTITGSSQYHYAMCILDATVNGGINVIQYQIEDPAGTWIDLFNDLNTPAATGTTCLTIHEDGDTVNEPAANPCTDLFYDLVAPVSVRHRFRVAANSGVNTWSFKCFYK